MGIRRWDRPADEIPEGSRAAGWGSAGVGRRSVWRGGRNSTSERGFHDRCDRRRRWADRLDAGHRVAAARRAHARAGEAGRTERAVPRAGAARAQRRDDGSARPAGSVPRRQREVPGRRAFRRNRQAVAGPAGHGAPVRPRHSATGHRAVARRACPRTRCRDPARLRGGRTEPGRSRGDGRNGRRRSAALAVSRRLRRRPQHGAQVARRQLSGRAQQGRDAAGGNADDRGPGDGGRRRHGSPQDPAAVRCGTARGRDVPRRRARRRGERGPRGRTDPRGVHAAAAVDRRHRLRRTLAALALPLR